jgi:SAM-dependent methyltransferase
MWMKDFDFSKQVSKAYCRKKCINMNKRNAPVCIDDAVDSLQVNPYTALVKSLLQNETLIRAVFSNRRRKQDYCSKVVIRPVLLQNQRFYQSEQYVEKKVLHQNLNKEDCLDQMVLLLTNQFKQVYLSSAEADYQILASKFNAPRIIKSQPTKEVESLTHNQAKHYILPDDQPCDFLINLGVMNTAGQVLKKYYSKFRQINRFLEIVEDVVDTLPKDKVLQIVDFGCGKAYLTFALYYYFTIVKNRAVQITGLDLKKEVVAFCNETASALGYTGLTFQLGDIADFTGLDQVDMVVTLHACDTATDLALIKAVSWQADLILSVPCCQHELFNQISNTALAPMLKHGILKERTSAILTDALRGLALESRGYEVTMIEFTSLEHTAKNIMIRAIKNSRDNAAAGDSFKALSELWQVKPAISPLLDPIHVATDSKHAL